jgi:hypothetical protein
MEELNRRIEDIPQELFAPESDEEIFSESDVDDVGEIIHKGAVHAFFQGQITNLGPGTLEKRAHGFWFIGDKADLSVLPPFEKPNTGQNR